MLALRRQSKNPRDARVETVAVPEPAANEVLLQVHYCGVCGSDLHAYLNHPGYESVLEQVTFGHEWSGTVVAVGSGVTGWNEGDRAIMIAIQGCLKSGCRYCASGDFQLCPKRRVQGLHLDGGMAQYVSVEPQYLMRLPADLGDREAALTEPLSVADHCVQNRSPIQSGDRVIVSGPGIIGMLCALVAREVGAQVSIAGTEADQDIRLAAAEAIGFPTCIVGQGHPPLAEQILQRDGDPVDVLIEASGASPALAGAADAVRTDGTITVVALYGQDVTLNVTALVRKQIDLITSYGSAQVSYERAAELLKQGKIPVDVLVREYPLSDGIQAFTDAEHQRVMKPLLVCHES